MERGQRSAIRRALVVGAIGLLMGACTSSASALTFRVRGVAAGPVLAGRSVAWSDGAKIMVRRGARSHRVARIAPKDPNDFLTVTLAASPQRIAYELVESQPAHGDSIPLSQTFGAATLTGPGHTILSCGAPANGGVDVSGSILLMGRLPGCAGSSGLQLRNLARPSSAPTQFPTNGHELVSLAGRYVAWSERAFTPTSEEADVVIVVNWVTGQPLYRVAVPGRISQMGLQSDGKSAIAYEPTGGGLARLSWASSAGALHVLAPRVDIVGGDVIIARNRIAFPRAINDEDSTPAIVSLSGRILQKIRSDPTSTKVTDYDGSCIAWFADASPLSSTQVLHVARGPGRPARGSACA